MQFDFPPDELHVTNQDHDPETGDAVPDEGSGSVFLRWDLHPSRFREHRTSVKLFEMDKDGLVPREVDLDFHGRPSATGPDEPTSFGYEIGGDIPQAPPGSPEFAFWSFATPISREEFEAAFGAAKADEANRLARWKVRPWPYRWLWTGGRCLGAIPVVLLILVLLPALAALWILAVLVDLVIRRIRRVVRSPLARS
jgi:hypothetical protein